MMDKLLTPISYNDCISSACDYFVKDGDRFCPNCGIDQNLPSILQKQENLKKASFVVFMGAGFSVMGLILIITTPNTYAGVFWLIFSLMVIATGAFYYFKNQVTETGCHFLSLSDSEKLIQERLKQIQISRLRINDVLGQVRFKGEDRWAKFRDNLEMALGVVERQSSRYNIKLHEINFLRWQNLIAPSFTNKNYYEFHKAKETMERLDKFILDGHYNFKKLETELEKYGDVGEKHSLLERYKETLASCDKIKDALIEQQAMLALRDISSLSGDAKTLALPPNVVREIEAFNASIDIDDFSNSIKELEAEFERIRIEDELSNETKLLMDQTENI